jgi:signal transduction histidine kinase
LTAELSGQVEQLGRRTIELAESRRRLITAADAERSRLERAIAREVLLHLHPLPDRLRQLSSARPAARPPVDPSSLEPLVESLNAALEALREITRGVFPAQLARSGLPTAIASLLARSDLTGRLTVDESAVSQRFDPRVEAAAYFCVAEATRAFDHAIDVNLSVQHDQLHLSVSVSEGGGLSLGHIRDRVEAAGGSVATSERDDHTFVEVRAPAARALAVS